MGVIKQLATHSQSQHPKQAFQEYAIDKESEQLQLLHTPLCPCHYHKSAEFVSLICTLGTPSPCENVLCTSSLIPSSQSLPPPPQTSSARRHSRNCKKERRKVGESLGGMGLFPRSSHCRCHTPAAAALSMMRQWQRYWRRSDRLQTVKQITMRCCPYRQFDLALYRARLPIGRKILLCFSM